MTDNNKSEEQPRRSWLSRFLLPKITPAFCLRFIILCALAYGFFGYLCIPAWTNGKSMEPVYKDGTFLFCWTPAYWSRKPRPGDAVMIKYGGTKVMLLKRVVAVEGDVVEFRKGDLYVNNEKVTARWNALTPCNWELPPRTVSPGHVYVVGDNRAMPMDEHQFGEVHTSKIAGVPLLQ